MPPSVQNKNKLGDFKLSGKRRGEISYNKNELEKEA
jgi:hypothetical protein